MTKRQVIESRRGICRDDSGRIVLTEEQKRQRLAMFEEKRMESEARAARCKSEIRAIRENLGVPLTMAEKVFSVPPPQPKPTVDPALQQELRQLKSRIEGLNDELQRATEQLEAERKESVADQTFLRQTFEEEIETRWKPLAAKLEQREKELAELMERLNQPSPWRRFVNRIKRIWSRNG